MLIEFFPSREIIVAIGSLAVRWYGLLWVLSFLLTAYLLPRLAKYRDVTLSRVDWWYISAWAMAGAIFGGRLGYVLLWEPNYYAHHLREIAAVWNGGMASHGGLIGVGLGLLWATRRLKIDFWKLLDVVVVPAALGLALGRVGNFINQELFDPPALAYLAVAKNLLIAAVCFWYLKRTSTTPGEQASSTPGVESGRVFALFLILYGIFRFLIEFVRVQEFAGALGLTRGQLFTLPVLAAGVLLWICQVVKIRSLRDAKRVILNRISTTWYGSKDSRKIT